LTKKQRKTRLWQFDPSVFQPGPKAGFLEHHILRRARALGKYTLYSLAFAYPVALVSLGIIFGGLVFWASFGINPFLLAMSYQALGQMKAAEAVFREAFSLPAYTDFAEFNRRAWLEFLLDRGRAQEALAESQDLVKSRWALGRFAGHTLAGRALLAMNRMEDARSELALVEQEMGHLPASVIGSLPNAGALRAEILLRENKWDEGNELMKHIEEKIGVVPGPDAWSAALFQLESIAQVARQVGDWELAEFTARRMIQHDRSYAGGHYALGLVAEHQGDAATARTEFATAEKLWSKADSDLARPRIQNP